ncbi:MAG: 50S ribosomal protein L24 [Candidatus Riflebacteria bacterium]|nr:50S ribosomal protein L24 [Candidatus Riflebacteria bacterium]
MLQPTVRKNRRLKKAYDKKQLEFRQFHLKRGDLVRVLSGKDRGKQGHVIQVLTAKGRVLVEKVNLVKRHQRPTQKLQKGGIIEKENSIHLSNVMLVCPHCKEAMRARNVDHEGTKTRVCRKCNEPLDLK